MPVDDGGDMPLLATSIAVVEVLENPAGLDGHGDPSFPQEIVARILIVVAVDHVVQCVLAEMFVDEQPLAVLDAASHKLFDVGVSKVSDGLDLLQKLANRHFRSRVAKVQHGVLEER